MLSETQTALASRGWKILINPFYNEGRQQSKLKCLKTHSRRH